MTICVMCHCKMRATCHCKMRVTVRCVSRVLGGRGPYNAPLFNLPILPEKKGGLKNNWFFETEVDFLSGWATLRVGVREPKRHL